MHIGRIVYWPIIPKEYHEKKNNENCKLNSLVYELDGTLLHNFVEKNLTFIAVLYRNYLRACMLHHN